MSTYQAVSLLNASYEPLGHVDFPRAMRMLARRVAIVEEADHDVDGNPRMVGPHPWPRVLRLVRYVSQAWRHKPAAWNRGALLLRDKHTCCYCGRYANTIDHIQPRSRGGKWSWLNCVAACGDCNEKKSNRTPEEAGMRKRFDPYVPTRYQVGMWLQGEAV